MTLAALSSGRGSIFDPHPFCDAVTWSYFALGLLLLAAIMGFLLFSSLGSH